MRTITLCFTKLIVPTFGLNMGNKPMPSEEKVSDGLCVSCVRLRFVFTKLIVPTFAAFAETFQTAVDSICAFSGAAEHLGQMRLISGGVFRHIGRFNHIVA